MAWFFRAIETQQGRWECRRGTHVFDDHPTVEEAVEHLRSLAADQHAEMQLFVHTRDGRVREDMAP